MPGKHDGDQPLTPGERWTMIFFVVLLLALFAGETFTNYRPVKLAGLLFVVFWMPLMVLHEFGHSLMAWLLGWRVKQIVLGMGKLLGTFHIGRTPVEVRLILTSGFMVPAPRRIRWPQMESALIYLAGPGIEIALVGVIAALVGLERLTTLHPNDYGMIVLQSLCMAALAGAIMNLLPFTISSLSGESTASDGLGFLRSLVTPTAVYARMIDGSDEDSWGEGDS
jgi:hypothetical protein